MANLGDMEVTTRAAKVFIRAFATSMSTGKQNTFVNHTVPDVVMVVVRDD